MGNEPVTTEATTADIGRPQSSTLLDAVMRLAFRIGFPLAHAWWSLRHPRHEGAQAVVSIGDRLLLVRSSYRPEWNFPGGGVRPGEPPIQAVRRELAEELGLHAVAFSPAGSESGLWEARRDTVHYFELRLAQVPELRWDNREVTGARLFRVADLDRVPVTGPVRAYLARTDRQH